MNTTFVFSKIRNTHLRMIIALAFAMAVALFFATTCARPAYAETFDGIKLANQIDPNAPLSPNVCLVLICTAIIAMAILAFLRYHFELKDNLHSCRASLKDAKKERDVWKQRTHEAEAKLKEYKDLSMQYEKQIKKLVEKSCDKAKQIQDLQEELDKAKKHKCHHNCQPGKLDK